MWKRILVPLDESVDSEAILGQIGRLLMPSARVTLLHVLAPLPSAAAAERRRESGAVEEARGRLERLAARFKGQASASVDCGEPARRILAVERAMDADLVAMTTHARGGVSRFVLGSVASEVLRHATCPVMLSRRGLHVPLRPMRRILLNHEDSPAGRRLLQTVGPLAAAFGCEVILLQIDERKPSEMERERFRESARELERAGVVTRAVMVDGEPVEETVRQGAWFDVDLIALCARDAGGLESFLGPGTAGEVLQRSDRPVLMLSDVGAPAPLEGTV